MGKGGVHRIASDNPVFNNNYSQSEPSTPCRLPNCTIEMVMHSLPKRLNMMVKKQWAVINI